MMIQQNFFWVESLKTVGILAVILGHIASPFGTFIFSWHMPLFFIISGFFIKIQTPLRKFITKDFQRLMVPYFIFALLGLGADFLKRTLLHREQLNYINEIEGILFQMDMNALIHHYGCILWFLPTLFFAKTLLLLIQKMSSNLVYSLSMVIALFAISFYVDLPFALDNAFNALFWIFIGFVFFQFYQENKFLYLLPFISLFIFLDSGIPILNMATKAYGNPLLNILWAVSIFYILVVILKKVNYSENSIKFVKLWGGNTMLLFILHIYTNNVAHVLVKKITTSWVLEFIVTLFLLQLILLLKMKFFGRGIFKYV